MTKVLKWVFGIVSFLIVATIIGLVIFISQFDLNEYKPQIEKIVYEQTGRKLSLNGDIEIKISLIPTVALNDAVFENAPWAKQKEMVSIKEADISLAILPLLDKEIEIGEINLIDPIINLAMNKDVIGNWVFEKPDEKNEDEKQDIKKDKKEEVNAASAPLLASFFAQKINIKNGIVNYADEKSNTKTSVVIKNFELEAEDNNDDIDLIFDVVFNKDEIIGTATGDSVNTILENKPYHIVFDTKAYGAVLKGQALLNDLMGDISFEGDLNLSSPKGNFDLPKTDFIGKVSGNLQKIKANISKLDFGGNVISGLINADISGKKPVIQGNIKSALIDLTKLQETQKTAYFELIATANAASFVPNESLDLSALNSVNAKIKADVQKLIINEDISISDVEATADLRDGVLSLNPLSFKAGGGVVSGYVTANANGNVMDINLGGKSIVAQDFIKSLDPSGTSNFGILEGGQTDINVVLKTSGATYPKLVENLNGQVLFVVEASRLRAGAMKYLKGNFISQLLSTLHIEAKDPKMSLNCAVVRADFKNGVATFPKGIVFDSKKMLIVGDGNINLKNDKIDVAIKPFNGNLTDTNIAQALSSLIKIGGTVSKPRIAVDTASVVKNVVGVAMTGPMYLGSQLLLDADPAPCYTALKGTVYSDMFDAPKGVKAGAQNAYQGTSDAVTDGIDAVTGVADAVVGGGANLVGGAAKGMFNMLTGNSSKKKK
ncbi:MAG: AsmA family protein [Alphaproteobacteria bacterium]|nr:AsmA family protein [Alphaproteobacteria bacterium]